MADNKNRYKDMERVMLMILLAAIFLFVTFLISSGNGILWLKAICAIFTILICVLCLVCLYLSRELLRQRSLWMTTAFACILLSVLLSLVLQFPSPRP